MKKANKVVLAQPAATAPGPVRGGESYRARLRYQSLLQDYKELLKESAAKKNRLHMEKLRKQRLLAEVKFLRRRYTSISENPSQTVVYKVKNPAAWDDRHWSVQAIGSSSKAPPTQQQWQHPAPRASPTIDLNEACEPSSEEMGEFHGYGESDRADKMNKYLLEGDVGAAGPSSAKIPAAFWDVQNLAVRAGKRKISWQDQLALRV